MRVALTAALFCSVLIAAPPCAWTLEVQAGVAQATFSLPDYTPLAGYSRRRGASATGTHDAVGVRALVLRDADRVLVVASCELLLIDERLFAAVKARLLAHGWPADLTLLLAATHTHSGPGAYGTTFLEKLSMGHFDPAVLHALTAHITETIVQASTALVPVRIAYGARRMDGWVRNRMDATGPVDDTLTICALYPHDGRQPLALLVGFSAHPTTLGAWNREFSGDYPGVLMRQLERQLPETVCLFLVGAVGDQAPVKQGTGFEPAQRLGRTLAEAVMTTLEELQPIAVDRLQAHQEVVALPRARVRWGWLPFPRWLSGRMADDDATLTVARLGNVVLLGVPCDMTASLGAQLTSAAAAHGLFPMVVGFASDYIGYCLPEALYDTEHYEASLALNGPRAGEYLVQRLTEMLHALADHAL